MGALTRLRVQVCATCCVLGGATAFLAYTQRGLLILGLALAVGVGLAFWLARSRPELLHPTHEAPHAPMQVPTRLAKPTRTPLKPVAEWPEEPQRS